jgi:hypothetical protein
MTFRDRIENFPEPYRTQMFANTSDEVLSSEDNQHTDAGIVASAFEWEASHEEYDYWSKYFWQLSKKEKPL